MRQVHLPVIEITNIEGTGAINIGRNINLSKVNPSPEKITLPRVPLGLPNDFAMEAQKETLLKIR